MPGLPMTFQSFDAAGRDQTAIAIVQELDALPLADANSKMQKRRKGLKP